MVSASDFAARQSDLSWLRARNRRCCAVVTDPQAFGIAASMRRVAAKYGLPTDRLLTACREVRAELDRSNELLPAYQAGIRALLEARA